LKDFEGDCKMIANLSCLDNLVRTNLHDKVLFNADTFDVLSMSDSFVQLCAETGTNFDLESGVGIFDLSKTTGPNSFGCSAAMVWRFWILAADKYDNKRKIICV